MVMTTHGFQTTDNDHPQQYLPLGNAKRVIWTTLDVRVRQAGSDLGTAHSGSGHGGYPDGTNNFFAKSHLHSLTMVRIAKSKAKQTQLAFKEQSQKLENAISAWKAEQLKPRSECWSARKITLDMDIPPTTLNDHINQKHCTQKEYIESCKKLSTSQEFELVPWIQVLDTWGMTQSQEDINLGIFKLERVGFPASWHNIRRS